MLLGEGNVDDLRKAIRRGADVDIQDKDYGRKTALMFAAGGGTIECVKYLAEHGAGVDVKAEDGKTALMCAAEKGRIECVKYLAEQGADIDAKDSEHGDTAVMAAARNGHIECVKCLIENGAADIDAKAKNGDTAVMAAARNGHIECVKYLIQHGADVNAKDIEYGGTALIWAAWKGHTECVKYLIEKGADVNAKAKNGKVALDIARDRSHLDIIQILKKTQVQIIEKTTLSSLYCLQMTTGVLRIWIMIACDCNLLGMVLIGWTLIGCLRPSSSYSPISEQTDVLASKR